MGNCRLELELRTAGDSWEKEKKSQEEPRKPVEKRELSLRRGRGKWKEGPGALKRKAWVGQRAWDEKQDLAQPTPRALR